MTQEVDSGALTLMQHALGLSGVDAEQRTFLQDGDIDQVTEISRFPRRSLTPFGRGYFQILFENVHGVAATLESFVDPYRPVNVSNGYPARVDPQKFEIWIGDAQCSTGQGGNFNQALFGFNRASVLQGPSDTAAGGPVTPALSRVFLGLFNEFAVTDGLGVEYGVNNKTNSMIIPIRRRWLPGEPLLFRSTSTGAGTITAQIQAFIGPVCLGQDLW